MAQLQPFTQITIGKEAAAIAQHGSNLSQLASDDTTWSARVERRFCISTSSARPKTHGGKTWKDAYHSMAHCQRVPRSKFTSARKVIFAKTSITLGGTHKNKRNINSHHHQNHPLLAGKHQASNDQNSNPISMWVLISHTDNCRTRRVRLPRNHGRAHRQGEEPRRYIEFLVCLQNAKSNGSDITVNPFQSNFVSLGMQHEDSDYESQPCLNEMTQVTNAMTGHHFNNDSDYYYCQLFRRHRRVVMPRIMHVHRSAGICTKSQQEDEHLDISAGITLKPLDFCIVSIPFPCDKEDVNETDVLARAVALQVPYCLSTDWKKQHSRVADRMIPDDHGGNGEEEWKENNASWSTAWFIPDNDVWQHYRELPGGFLTLADKDRMVNP